MKGLACGLWVVLVAACGTSDAGVRVAPTGAEPAPADGQASRVPGRRADVCSQDGTLDFSVHGTGLEGVDGRLIQAAAVQPIQDPESFEEQHPVVVLLSTEVSGGAYALACPQSLVQNSWYPSYAVWLDQDGDGVCSGADLGAVMQLYGWVWDVEDERRFGVHAFPLDPVSQLHGWHGPFCEYYRFGAVAPASAGETPSTP